jgi:hypothetical protein
MTRPPKRPRDANQLAKHIVGIATGEVEDRSESSIFRFTSRWPIRSYVVSLVTTLGTPSAWADLNIITKAADRQAC